MASWERAFIPGNLRADLALTGQPRARPHRRSSLRFSTLLVPLPSPRCLHERGDTVTREPYEDFFIDGRPHRGEPIATGTISRLIGVPICPDLLDYAAIGEADNRRGKVVRAFFWLMRAWPA
jgi:hypothetical protein